MKHDYVDHKPRAKHPSMTSLLIGTLVVVATGILLNLAGL